MGSLPRKAFGAALKLFPYPDFTVPSIGAPVPTVGTLPHTLQRSKALVSRHIGSAAASPTEQTTMTISYSLVGLLQERPFDE